jgi:two-component system chemotaxis sensor kinase CheA
MIDDKELLALFREESDEYLQSLDDGLMRLESEPQNAAVLQQVFRDAHSLKGAARMLGIGDVEIVAHHFEDALGGAARGGAKLSHATIETLYNTLDALRALVGEAVTGKPANIDMPALLANFNATANAGAQESTSNSTVLSRKIKATNGNCSPRSN